MSILVDTIKRDNDEELIFWNDENICTLANRNLNDDIANYYLPRLMQIKDSMKYLEGKINKIKIIDINCNSIIPAY